MEFEDTQIIHMKSSQNLLLPSTSRISSSPSQSRNTIITAKYRNPYLNFLQEFRKRNASLSPVEVVRHGAEKWRSLSMDDKLGFVQSACIMPIPSPSKIFSQLTNPSECPFCKKGKKKRRRGGKRKSRRQRRSRRQRKSSHRH